MSYFRVNPRDLFNESKLLKCLGQIALMIHDNKIPGLEIHHDNERSGYKIDQDENDGSIYVSNMHFSANNGGAVHFYHPLNSKENYPLMLIFEGELYHCFSEKGELLFNSNLFIKQIDI